MSISYVLLFIDGSELLRQACFLWGQIGSHLSCYCCSTHPVLVQHRGTTHVPCNTHAHIFWLILGMCKFQLLSSFASFTRKGMLFQLQHHNHIRQDCSKQYDAGHVNLSEHPSWKTQPLSKCLNKTVKDQDWRPLLTCLTFFCFLWFHWLMLSLNM